MVISRTPTELAALLRDPPGKVVLLDVRELYERELARIDPSIHIPMNDIPARRTEIPTDREVVVYCHSGTRSALVAGYLEREGYKRTSNLKGGIDAWSVEVDPTVPRYD